MHPHATPHLTQDETRVPDRLAFSNRLSSFPFSAAFPTIARTRTVLQLAGVLTAIFLFFILMALPSYVPERPVTTRTAAAHHQLPQATSPAGQQPPDTSGTTATKGEPHRYHTRPGLIRARGRLRPHIGLTGPTQKPTTGASVMHRYTKLLLASLSTAAIFALAVGSASANRLSLSNRNFRVTWTSLRFSNTANANVVLCPTTLEGSFHSATIVKTVGALIGYVTRASLVNSSCIGGHATIRTETLPWHIRYRGYSGTLPNITLILVGLSRARFRVETGGLTCDVTTEDTGPPSAGSLSPAASRHRSHQTPLQGYRWNHSAASLAVKAPSKEVSQTLTLLGATTRITVTLI